MDVMDICKNLTPQQRDRIVGKFVSMNPHWSGAHVEDIIDELDNQDGYLATVEKAWEDFPSLQQPGFGSAVRCLYLAGEPIDEGGLKRLLTPPVALNAKQR